jgi:hypothetical protein
LVTTLPLIAGVDCAPPVVPQAHVCVIAGPEAAAAAERAAATLRADGHAITVLGVGELDRLAGADAVLVLGGLELEAAARAAAPAHAYVCGELLEGPATGWDALVLRVARAVALAAAPSMAGMCG